MPYARRVELEVLYEGKNITTPLNEYSTDFSYTDVASGESDSVSIGMHDIGKEWISGWMPSKGDRISTSLILKNWDFDGDTKRFYCGGFELDDLSFSGRPMQVSIGGVSIPRNEPFNTQLRTKTWECVTLLEIAQEVAGRAKISVYYEAPEIRIENTEQNEETDCKFLYSLCADYGLAMKVYENRIIIFDEEAYESKPSVRILRESRLAQWNYNTTVAGTYTGASIKYVDPCNEEEYMVTVGGGSRILEINESTDSIQDAEKKAIARLHNENKKAVTMSLTLMADVGLVAGVCVEIAELGKIDGKYYLDKVVTSKGGSKECSMSLTMHRVVPRIKTVSITAVSDAAKEGAGAGASYTVVTGDTLWGIARRFYGRGTGYERIYQANKEIIEETAKSRGKKDSSNGHWIFPGTSLRLPPKEEIV